MNRQGQKYVLLPNTINPADWQDADGKTGDSS